MVRYLTGHAHLRRHNKIANTPQPVFTDLPQMNYTLEDPDDRTESGDRQIICHLCKLAGHEETSFHLFRDCLRAWETRLNLLGSYSFEQVNTVMWDPVALLKFFKHFDLENKPNTL